MKRNLTKYLEWQRRSVKRYQENATRKPIRRVSAKGAAYEREFAAQKRRLLPAPCIICGGEAVTLHHIKRRSQGGTNDATNLMPVCHADHRKIHDNVAWAKERGYLA